MQFEVVTDHQHVDHLVMVTQLHADLLVDFNGARDLLARGDETLAQEVAQHMAKGVLAGADAGSYARVLRGGVPKNQQVEDLLARGDETLVQEVAQHMANGVLAGADAESYVRALRGGAPKNQQVKMS